MKTFFAKNGLLLGLVAALVVVFAVGGAYSRYMTNQIKVHEVEVYFDYFDGATSVEKFDSVVTSKTYNLFNRPQTFEPSIDASYKILAGTEEIGVVYIINSYGKMTGLKIGYAIDFATKSCIGALVVSHSETPDYFIQLNNTFFAQFNNLDFEDIGLSVDTVAGVTYSSKGFEIGLLYAREAFAADFGFQIPDVALTLVNLGYNFNPATFVASPFIANITYGETNTEATVYLSSTFEYVGLLGGGTDLDADIQAALQNLASSDGSVSSATSFISYDEVTKELVMHTRGYNSVTPISVLITLNVTEDGIIDYVVTSSESYDDPENGIDSNGEYAGTAVPDAENDMLNDYLADNDPLVDAIAGASEGTFPAMQALINLLDAFIDSRNGGQ